jgi:hypothetical protein
MKKSEVIKLARNKTQYRGEKLDVDTMFKNRLLSFCLEDYFWWRRKSFSFNSVVGTAAYDITNTDVIANGVYDLDEVIKVFRVDAGPKLCELDPVIDPMVMEFAQEDTTRDLPGSYFFVPGAATTIQLVRIPNSALKYRVQYWAVPNDNPNAQADDDAVALVPPQYHFALVDGMVMDIQECLFGTESQKFVAAAATYKDSIVKVQGKREIVAKKARSLSVSDDAIRST